VIEHPSAAPKVRALSPAEADARVKAGTLVLVDVRPLEERTLASVDAPVRTLDDGTAYLEALPRDTPLAFLCHHGQRSAQAAEHFRGLGFREVYNITGGIEAWSNEVDAGVPRY
jgi:monothiol glutaredoxin